MRKIILSLMTLMSVTIMAQKNQTYLTLNNGVKMPQFGLGVYSIPDGEETYNSVMTALKCGYRHIDTAHAYQNERSVGRAVKDSGIDRSEIWITSKLWPNEYGEGYQRMIDASAAQRVGTSDEIAEAAAFLLGEHAWFITGTDLLIDGGVIAAIRTGEYQLG